MMATYNQTKTTLELMNQGWEGISYPNKMGHDVDIHFGGPVFMCNADKDIVMVDHDGKIYQVTASIVRQHAPVTVCQSTGCII